MWALRRAGNPLRFRAQQVVSARSFANLDVLGADAKSIEEHHGKDCQKPCCRRQSKPVVQLPHSSGQFVLSRTFSSQAGANSGDKEDELEDGFSDLEVPPETGNKDASSTSEDSSDEDAIDEIDLSDVKPEKEHMKRFQQSAFLQLMLDAPKNEVAKTLEKWTTDGNTADRSEVFFTLLNLRRRKWYRKALELMDWIEEAKLYELEERHYASRLDLVAKVSGLHSAEQYIEKIPSSHRGEIVYRTLLANCVAEANVRKAEQIFNKIKDLGLPITIFTYNQLLLLYKRVDKKKIADVLAMMENDNLKPSLFTYKLLVDTKGAFKDIEGMEKVVESMWGEGIKPDYMLQATIARHYIFNGHHEKAEALLESMEGDNIKENRNACKVLLPLYAFLGKKDEVERIWEMCGDNTRADEAISAIEAFGRLGDTDKAEKIFEDMSKKWKRPGSKIYNALLRVYANKNLFDKGKELAKQMRENGARMGIPTLDALVKLYIDAGEVEKGDNILHKLSHEYKLRPQFNSYRMLLEAYSKKGDIHNSEKIFNKLRQAGYSGRITQYQLLLQAYYMQNALLMDLERE
ncbi:hypothetical protein PR202_gb26992 [Eleusine coracana subsp. coracana]|uniref:PROP1-like PPR domain-containing protein n=1 Tax=Eleusine coracana subsp. coracana TaxID=191504 RepID=A0AAV5FTC7_ELECO|nr:hypothetical protein PR202_gb26992 [Eleusine coracana subsp. coracana]